MIDGFGRRLDAAERFVDAAALVCHEAKQLGVRATWIALHFEHGAIALAIDSAPDLRDDDRLRRIREHGTGSRTGDPRELVAPLVGKDGVYGTIAWATVDQASRQLERELTLLATQLAVWCTRRGVEAVPATPAADELGPRQHRIAQLAARGLSNAAIGEALAISINTVKARLKEVFERLAVHNRTELAHAMLRRAPLDGIPPGITRLPTVTITRAPAYVR